MKTELSIESGCLKAVGRENKLPAAPTNGFCLRFNDQTTTKAPPAQMLGYPDLTQLAGLPPGMARRTRDYALGFVSQKDAEASTIGDASRGPVEIIQSVFEELDVRGRGISVLKAIGVHRIWLRRAA